MRVSLKFGAEADPLASEIALCILDGLGTAAKCRAPATRGAPRPCPRTDGRLSPEASD